MVCGRSFVLSPRGGANVRGRPDKGKQDKTKRNRDKTARQRLGSRRDPCQPNQSFLVKAAGFYPPSPYTTYNHPVSTPDTMGPDCCSYSNAPCFSLMNRSPAQWEGCSPDLENPQKIQKLLAFKCEPTQEEHVKHSLFTTMLELWEVMFQVTLRFHFLPRRRSHAERNVNTWASNALLLHDEPKDGQVCMKLTALMA